MSVNALQLSFSSIIAVRTFSGSYYFLSFQVNSAFLSWTIRVIAEIKPKCHDWAGCHQMEVSCAKLFFLHCKATVILFCKYYRGVYYCSHLFILLYHLRAVLTDWSVLCTEYKQRTKKLDCEFLSTNTKASGNRWIKMTKALCPGHSEWALD